MKPKSRRSPAKQATSETFPFRRLPFKFKQAEPIVVRPSGQVEDLERLAKAQAAKYEALVTTCLRELKELRDSKRSIREQLATSAQRVQSLAGRVPPRPVAEQERARVEG